MVLSIRHCRFPYSTDAERTVAPQWGIKSGHYIVSPHVVIKTSLHNVTPLSIEAAFKFHLR